MTNKQGFAKVSILPMRARKKTYDEESLYEYAVGALARRMRTVAELKRLMRQKLMGSENADALMDAVVARLKEHKYLDDARYAAAYSTNRRDNEKLGRRRVVTDLKVRGVHGDLIEKAVAAAYSGVNEETHARKFLARKRLNKPASQKDAARIFRTMARAGFSIGVIVRILKKWDVDEEVLMLLESS
jgi:regulatory protein